MKFFPLFFYFYLSCLLSFSLEKSSIIDSLEKKITVLAYSNQYDSAQSLVLTFLGQKKLSDLEIFYGNSFLGDILKSSGKTTEAIKQFLKSENYLKNIPENKKYKSLTTAKIAEAYFDVSNFTEAKKFALLSIQLNPDSSIRTGGHAVNYNILGYGDYLEKKFSSALDFYSRAIEEYLKTGELCELPLCYMKIAKVHNSMKNEAEVGKYLEKAVSVSDSCKIKNYNLLSLYTILDIYKENKNYKEALETLEEINELVKEIGFERQRHLMSELGVKYETKLAHTENENLKEINQKNEEILSQQKLALTITIAAIFLLTTLIFFIVKISNQRKKVLLELANKNRHIQTQNTEFERLHVLNQKIFSVISHDFRGPIMSLQLLLKALRDKNFDAEKISGYTEDISFQLIQTKQVLENLLNWARTELNVSVKKKSSTNPFSIAHEISMEQKIIAAKKNINVRNTIPEDLELQIPPDILRIVFRNLLSNAVKFSFENSEIIFDYDEKTNQLLVKDSGTGIDENKIRNLFQKDIFPSLGTWKEGGFGLGLFITHELLHRFNSKIFFGQNQPEGTVFRVFIPKTDND